MSFRFEIIENNIITIYRDDSEIPVHFQGAWPNGVKFESSEIATEWAEMFIESVVNPEAPFAPIGPGEPALPKITAEALAMLQQHHIEQLDKEPEAPSEEELAGLQPVKLPE